MRKLAPLAFNFVYSSTPISEACVRGAYRRLLMIAERNLIAKGLLGDKIQRDIDSREMHVVDNRKLIAYSGNDGAGRISNYPASSPENKAIQSDYLSHDQTSGNPGSEDRTSMAN